MDVIERKAPGENPPAIPLDAATVILVRDSTQPPHYKVFLMRRHRRQDFMAGAFVFPGGRLDKGDCDPGLASCAHGVSAIIARERLQEPEIPAETALGLFFAAVREMFEESGVLLAYDSTGHLISLGEGETAGRFAEYRLKLHERQLSLKQLAQTEQIRYGLDRLIPYSHWITPEVESKRFNTRFFLAHHPPGQIPSHDTIEMTQSLWLTPAAALESHKTGEILLMPPTLKTLEELSAYHSTHELFSAAASHRIDTILPEAFVTEDGFGVKLPHDPEYTIAHYKQPPRPGEPSRIVLRDRRWRMVNLPDER
jgi:8-oxo-dGTP pyrophosphatase MutT (NUDIX family)